MEDKDVRPMCEVAPERLELCPCARLGAPTPLGSDEALPDHAGEAAMRSSCRAWIEEVLGPDADPDARVVIPLGMGHSTEPVRASDWPIPVRGTPYQLMLVIRQWVEEPPEKQLARLLREEPAWQRAVKSFREGAASPEAVLLANGLPPNPATAAHLRAAAAGAADELPMPYPARGVLVHSHVLQVPRDGPGLHDEVVPAITATFPWATDALLREAHQVAGKHKDWWADHPLSNVVDMSLRRTNRRAPDELTDDVEAYLRGELDAGQVERRAIERLKALMPGRWTQRHVKACRKNTRSRIRDAERRRSA